MCCTGCWEDEILRMVLKYLVLGNTEIRQDLISTLINGKNVQHVDKVTTVSSLVYLCLMLHSLCKGFLFMCTHSYILIIYQNFKQSKVLIIKLLTVTVHIIKHMYIHICTYRCYICQQENLLYIYQQHF